MKTFSANSRSQITRKIPRFAWYLSAYSLTMIGFLLAVSPAYAVTNHPPTISWMRDQAVTASNQFDQVYFRAWDKETTLTTSNITTLVENDPNSPNFYTGIVHIAPCTGSDTGCPHDGTGYKLSFDPLTQGNGAATIKITVTDGGNLSAATSFTLRKKVTAVNPPVLAGIPNEQIQMNSSSGYGPVWFVVSDLDMNGVQDSNIVFTWLSDNTNLVPPVTGVSIQQVGNGLTYAVTVLPAANQMGRAVITITAQDPDLFKTSTSFVLDVISASNTAPSFTTGAATDGTWIEQDVTQNPNILYHFKVTDSQTPKNQLLVTATSSNAKLVPNDSTHLTVSSISNTGFGTLTITPVLPLPSPSPGVPQAATVTLAVTDDAYTRRKQFLYVAQNPTSPALSFSRPTGVYNLDPKMPQDHRPNDSFLTGEMRRIAWYDLETSDGVFDWQELDDAVADLPTGQVLSLNLKGEPCYIAGQGTYTWCDTGNPNQQNACGTTCTGGVLRALPWDPFLQQRRRRFLTQLANHVLPTGNTVANEPLIPIINCNLPGGDTGIRELSGQPFSATNLPGYSRSALFTAVETELRAVQGKFPAKLVHIGFFTVEDDLDGQYGGESLWHWLYPQLANEFNGTTRPRVHFFQEDLAAARASAAPDYIPYISPPNKTAYSSTPNHCQLPSFSFACGLTTDDCDPLSICPPTDLEYNNGITFQANTPWSGPFAAGDKVSKTLNGTPNDGMEAAFNSYLNEYLEVYQADLDHAQPPAGTPAPWDAAKWAAGLQSWKDYFDHVHSARSAGRSGPE